MDKYCVNKHPQVNGDHEVHNYNCFWLPDPENREYLGEFVTCHGAVNEAKNRGYPSADGCAFCCPACNLR